VSVRRFFQSICLVALALASTEVAAAPAERPNVLFVVFDDLDNRIGCYGDPAAKSRS
jgi:hypothetical protein